MNKVIVCPIAYNENIKIKSVIARFLKSPLNGRVDFVVVDDGSTDETQSVINGFADKGVGTLRHPVRQGVGAAIRSAVKFARLKGYEIIVIMAGNDKDDPEEIGRLIEPILAGECDFIQGSRYIGGKRIGGDMPLYRKLATRLHPSLLSFFLKRKLTDSTNGFRAVRLALFDDKNIDLDQDWLNTYELEPYILFKAIRLGYRFKEVPVTKIYPAKNLGYTKMRPLIGWWSILKPVIYLGLGIKK